MRSTDLGTRLQLGESTCARVRVIVGKPQTVAYYRDF